MPSTNITVMVPTQQTTVSQGDLLLISTTATDPQRNTIRHWLEKKLSGGAWSAISVDTVTNGRLDNKTAFDRCSVVGTFVYRSVSQLSDQSLIYSQEVTVVVIPVGGIPQPPPPVTLPPPPSAATLSASLGPTWLELNPGVTVDDRPTLFEPVHHTLPPEESFGNKISPWESGVQAAPDTDYWSSSGQVARIPDATLTPDRGLDRIAVYAYYNHVHATSPRPEGRNDRIVQESFADSYFINNLKVDPGQVTWITRNYGMLSNEGLAVFESTRILGCIGTQTSRSGADWPLPIIQFPANKKLIRVALTSSNEFALVLMKDLTTGNGQVAVVALEGKYLPLHTFQYMAFPNQGSWSDFKLMGYIDLPGMPNPDSIDAASNGYWDGPSQTANKTLGQIDMSDSNQRVQMETGDYGWAKIISNKGYFIVSSKTDGKVLIYDMAQTFAYIRQAYFHNFDATIAAKAAGTFPVALNSSNTPTLALTLTATLPTYVLAGRFLDRWMSERDHHKAYFTTQDGTLTMIDVSSLMVRGAAGFEFEGTGALAIIGSVMTGKNPTSMCFGRFPPDSLPLYAPGEMVYPAVNSLLHVCCRGDRCIKSVVTRGSTIQVYQTIKDTRIDDPVAVAVTDRGNIMTICDFFGKKLVGVRIGPLWDRVDPWLGLTGARWGPGADGNAPLEISGVLAVPGYPYATNSANVN